MLQDLLGPLVTCAAALAGIRGNFWDVAKRRPTILGVVVGLIALAGLGVSYFAARDATTKAEALNATVGDLNRQLKDSAGKTAELKASLDAANGSLTTVRGELDDANRRLSRMNNVELRNDYAQGKWQGTFPSGSILKGLGFSCDATIKTESGLKKAEFTIPHSETGDAFEVPLFGANGEPVDIVLEFAQPQCDGKIMITGTSPN